jgi:multimeric flavodoxin WrbA
MTAADEHDPERNTVPTDESSLAMARVVAVCGSERRGGNTDLVLEHAAVRLRQHRIEVTRICLRDKRILGGCGPCGDCNTRNSKCRVGDDVASIVAAMSAADGIIYATPVHAFGMSSLMQAFLERAGVGHLRFERPLANRVAAVIVTGRRYNHDLVHTQLVSNILLNRMILAGSGFPALVLGGRPGAALDDLEGLAAVDATLDRMVGMIQFLGDARAAGVDMRLLQGATPNERVHVRAGSHAHAPEIAHAHERWERVH